MLDDIDISPTIKVNNQGQITDGIDTLSKEDSGTFIANLPNTIIEGILDGSLLGQVGDKGDQGDTGLLVLPELRVLQALPELKAASRSSDGIHVSYRS